MGSKYDEDPEDDELDIIDPLYKPSEYELIIDHLLESYHEDLIIKIIRCDGSTKLCNVLFVDSYAVRVIVHNPESTIESTFFISEIKETEIERLRKDKKG